MRDRANVTWDVDRWCRVGGLVAMVVVWGVGCQAGGGDAESVDGGDVGGGDVRGERSVVASEAWEEVGASGDPLAEHRPGEVRCPAGATEVEELQGESTLSVNTGACNYHAGRQEARVGLRPGDVLEVRLWHFALTAESAGEAHAAVLIDGEVVWETRVALPKEEGGLVEGEIEIERTIPKGARVGFHLHNHGENQWNLIGIDLVGE